MRTDGTSRWSFLGLFSRPAFSLAAFENWFYWVDGEGLWQAPQNQADWKRFLSKAELPLLAVHHPLQQPAGTLSRRRRGFFGPSWWLTASRFPSFRCFCVLGSSVPALPADQEEPGWIHLQL